MTSGLGTSSGNGNDFTATGFNTDESSTDYDLMADSPTQNYATLNEVNPLFTNPSVGGSGDTTDANLTMFNTRNGASGCYVDGYSAHSR